MVKSPDCLCSRSEYRIDGASLNLKRVIDGCLSVCAIRRKQVGIFVTQKSYRDVPVLVR